MVLVDNWHSAECLRSFRNLCHSSERRFLHKELGFNYRMTNLQAAIGVGQLKRIDDLVGAKRVIGNLYNEQLAGVEGLQLPVEKPWAKNVYWVNGIVVDEETGLTAADLSRRLADFGVDTRPFFLGMHEQPVFRKMGLFSGERYPVAECLSRQGLYLPSGVGLTKSQIKFVCDAVREVLRGV